MLDGLLRLLGRLPPERVANASVARAPSEPTAALGV
jgi:hypothetical protein